MGYVTLKQLTKTIIALPKHIQNKPIGYLDIGHMT